MRMDMEGEYQPLIEKFHTRKNRRCMKIPYQAALTFLVIGCFLLVVLLLIVIEKSKITPEQKAALAAKEKIEGKLKDPLFQLPISRFLEDDDTHSSIENIQKLITEPRKEGEKNRLLRKSKYTQDEDFPKIFNDLKPDYEEVSLEKLELDEKEEEKLKEQEEHLIKKDEEVLKQLLNDIKAKQKNIEEKLDFIENILNDDFLKDAYLKEKGDIENLDVTEEPRVTHHKEKDEKKNLDVTKESEEVTHIKETGGKKRVEVTEESQGSYIKEYRTKKSEDVTEESRDAYIKEKDRKKKLDVTEEPKDSYIKEKGGIKNEDDTERSQELGDYIEKNGGTKYEDVSKESQELGEVIEKNGGIKVEDVSKESQEVSLEYILTSPKKTEKTDKYSTENYNDYMDKFEDLLRKKKKILEDKLEKIKSITRDLKNDLLKAAYDVKDDTEDKKDEIINELLGLQTLLKIDSDEGDSKDDELLSSLFSFGKKIYNSPNSNLLDSEKYNNHKFDNVEKGWKKLPQMSEKAVSSGCPFKMADSSPDAAELLQTFVNCANLAEDMRKEYGKCIDLSFLPKECKPSLRQKCFSNYMYRKIDGSCNNRFNPTWGMAGIPFVRMIAPDFSDGISAFRLSKDGSPLPNARSLSQKLYTKLKKGNTNTSLLFMFFGLFVDHDMVETALTLGNTDCCKLQENLPKECMPILISPSDSFYGPKNVTCLNLFRSLPGTGECAGKREQLNRATSFLDGSVIYGSTIAKAKSLRSFHNGQLKTQWINNAPFMEPSNSDGYSCGTNSDPLKCFATGDPRANMLVDLTAMHTLWYREHNRIASILSLLQPLWTDERLYQEARKVLIAELQHITYNEFLPMLLGDEAMDYFGLKMNQGDDCDSTYDETISPSVFNVFGAAAFRFGHSLAQDMIELLDSGRRKMQVPLHTTMFNVQLLYEKGLDQLLRGAVTQRLRTVDSFITNEVREHLFQSYGTDYGYDLAAVGIQRTRDHGLPSYVKWRSVCGLSEIRTWKDLNEVMDPERAHNLKEIYKFVEDIDVIPGALAEYHVDGAMIGPTYLCIIGRQFRKTKRGDRFFFENKDVLNKKQLAEIYHSTMSRIICDNSDGIKQVQKYAFMVSSDENPVLDCEDIPKIDFSKWTS